jgi:hypothetical protein
MAKYSDLIFGTFSQAEVLDAIRSEAWQTLRVSLHGLSTDEKLSRLRSWLRTHDTPRHRICVTNYVYALKRGGLLK